MLYFYLFMGRNVLRTPLPSRSAHHFFHSPTCNAILALRNQLLFFGKHYIYNRKHMKITIFKIDLLIFLTSFSFCCLISPGNLTGDTEIRWSVARQMARGSGFYIEDSIKTNYYARGINGQKYSFWGLGQPLFFLPFAEIGLVCENLFNCTTAFADLLSQFLVSVVLFPIFGALCVWIFYRILLLLDYGKGISALSSSLFFYGTMHLHYSVNTHEQSQVAFFLLSVVWLMIKNSKKPCFSTAFLLCLSLGMCLLFRLDSVATVVPLYLVAALSEAVSPMDRSKRTAVIIKWVLAGMLGTGIIVLCICWYNYVRFGSYLETGYMPAAKTMFGGIKPFNSRLGPNLGALLLSPGKSIFLYNPILLLLPFCLCGFYKKHKALTIAILLAVTGNLILSSFHTTWAGDYAWGCRYQASVVPLLALPLVLIFEKPLARIAKAGLTIIITISVVIQLASVLYGFHLEFVQNPNHTIIPDSYIWDWSQSHLIKRFDNSIRHLTNRRNFTPTAVEKENVFLLKSNRSVKDVKIAYSINFFPFKAKAMSVSNNIFYILLVGWICCLIVFLVCLGKYIPLMKRLILQG